MAEAEEVWKQKIISNWVFLLTEMESDVILLSHLLAAKVLNKVKKKELQEIQDSYNRNDALADYLTKRTEEDYYRFIRALIETKQEHIVNRIEGITALQWKFNPDYPYNSLDPFLDSYDSEDPLWELERCNIRESNSPAGASKPQISTYETSKMLQEAQGTILLTGGSKSTDFVRPKSFDSIKALQQTSNTSFKCFPMPALTLKTKRCDHQSVLIKGSIITMGGINIQRLSSVESIDLRTHAKCDIASMINARSAFAVGIIGNIIYVCGGWNGDNCLNLCEYYNIETKKWSAFQNMNAARHHHAGAVLNDTFYITGGTPTRQTVECYSPIADRWTACPNLNYDRLLHGCVQLEGQIYVCGGFDTVKSCECYDPREGIWNKCAPMNQRRRRFAMTSAGEKLYAIGGWDGSKMLGSVEIYEPRNDKWIILEDAIEPCNAMSAVVI